MYGKLLSQPDGRSMGVPPEGRPHRAVFCGDGAERGRPEGHPGYGRGGNRYIRQQIEVAEGRTTEVIVGMARDLPEPPPAPLQPLVTVRTERTRAPRPTWRLILGGASLSAGALVIGIGANALQLMNTCLDPGPLAPTALCGSRLQPANFSIGAIAGGLLLVGGGITLVAQPGRWQTTDTFTYSPAEPSPTR